MKEMSPEEAWEKLQDLEAKSMKEMSPEEAWENLQDLAAMRLMYAFPIEEARKKFSEIYGEIDEAALRTRRLNAIATFKKMFGWTGEGPRHGQTFAERFPDTLP